MNQPDPTQNSLDRREPDISIEPEGFCLICQGAMMRIILRPLPICTPCLYELSDRIDEAQATVVVMSADSIDHSQN
jgi:hypothetical protein